MRILIILFFTNVFMSHAQSYYVLEGTIGKYPIVMKIDSNSYGDPVATYFYKKQRKDISLSGKKTGVRKKNWVFQKEGMDPKDPHNDIVLETFQLQSTGTGNLAEWNGIWVDEKGSRLPVRLKPVSSQKYNLSSIPDPPFGDTLYEKLRLIGLQFVTDSITMSGNVQLHWMHESLSKLRYFVIGKGYADVTIRKINKVIRNKYFDNLINYFTCEGNRGGYSEFYSMIHDYFFSEQHISVISSASWDCGGAHPSGGDNSFTIDAKTGAEITDLGQLYWFTGKKPLTEKDSGYYGYIEERGKSIVAILTKLFPVEMRKPISEDDCDYSDAQYWQFPSWYFTSKGLYLGTSFPHVSNNCNFPEFSIIPYSILQKYTPKQ